MFQPCLNNGTLMYNPDRSWYCSCPNEYFGTYCETANPCAAPDACYNDGTCFPFGATGNYICICPNNYQGPRCETSSCQETDSLCPSLRRFCNTSKIRDIPVNVYCPITCGTCKSWAGLQIYSNALFLTFNLFNFIQVHLPSKMTDTPHSTRSRVQASFSCI